MNGFAEHFFGITDDEDEEDEELTSEEEKNRTRTLYSCKEIEAMQTWLAALDERVTALEKERRKS